MAEYFFPEYIGAVAEDILDIWGHEPGPHNYYFHGPPGAGKTFLAYWLAKKVGCNIHKHICTPTSESKFFFDFDVKGIIQRNGSFIKGPCWRAFEESHHKPVILIYDEIDKASSNAYAPLLGVFDDVPSFESPEGVVVTPDSKNLLIITTSNESKELYPALKRRFTRVAFEFPDKKTQTEALFHLTGLDEKGRILITHVINMGEKVFEITSSPEERPSLVEMARIVKMSVRYAKRGVTSKNIWKKMLLGQLFKSPDSIGEMTKGFASATRTLACTYVR